MKLLPLTKGKSAKVDDSDFDSLNALNWCAMEAPNGAVYATRAEADPRPGWEGRRRTVYLHRRLLCAEEGVKVLFADGDTLNCQRSNISVITSMRYRADRKIRRFVEVPDHPGIAKDTETGGYVHEIGGGNYSRKGALGYATVEDAEAAMAVYQPQKRGAAAPQPSSVSTKQGRALLDWLRKEGTTLHGLFAMDASVKGGRLVFTRPAPWHGATAPLLYPAVDESELAAMRGWLAEGGHEVGKFAVREAVVEAAWGIAAAPFVASLSLVPKDAIPDTGLGLSAEAVRAMTEEPSADDDEGLNAEVAQGLNEGLNAEVAQGLNEGLNEGLKELGL